MTPFTKDQARSEIAQLVARFKQQETLLLNEAEAQIENDFIRPLFEFLNWDVQNKSQTEFALQRTTREGNRPDYILQIDGQHLFVMDAKKVKYEMHDPRWLNQVYAYAYSTQNNTPSKKIDFAILTDFQEFIVLDCTLLASKPEALTNFRVIDWRYDAYVNRFDELWELFERNNVLAARVLSNAPTNTPTGIWARYLSPKQVKANRISPDKAFLSALDDEKTGWRVRLAKDMKKHNQELDGNVLTAAVQLLIDRLVFVKVLSDREIEDDYLAKMAATVERDGLAEEDCGWFVACKNLFGELNAMYNGSIFAPRPELEAVTVSNRVVREIIEDLLPENSPYNFAVLPVEILGTIYERFLGRVVNATAQRVKIEDKPEVRKAGGVYYTPQYIVRYIVQNTVGKLLADCKTPADVARLKILDPACGSGSFLLGAYAALIDWHVETFRRNVSTKRDRDAYYLDDDNRVRLTAKLKRQILLNNLFGVDIDPQAVEVTRLSLSLKALEDTRSDEAHQERTLFNQTLLPDLSANIKCGNSLIGADYLVTTDEELRRVKPFDWAIAFPEIFSRAELNRENANASRAKEEQGFDAVNTRPSRFPETSKVSDARGFDAVIGNPPYIQLSMADYFDAGVNRYITQRYNSSMGRLNTFGLFIDRALQLLGNNSLVSFIVPNTILTQEYYQGLRKEILQYRLESITTYRSPVFADAVVETIVFVVRKSSPDQNKVLIVDYDNNQMSYTTHDIDQTVYSQSHENAFLVRVDATAIGFREKLVRVSNQKLGKIANINQAIALKFDRSESLFKERKAKNYKTVLDGRNIQRYSLEWGGYYLAYDVSKIHSCKRTDIFEAKEKIFFRRVGDRLIATYDDKQFYALNTLVVITPIQPNAQGLKYTLALLNSRLLNYYYVTYLKSTKKVFSEIQARQIAQLPIRTINFADATDKARHDRMVILVEQMLDLHKRLHVAKTETDRELYQRQIDATDKQIDALVYQLYGLTDEEIKIVEGG